MSIIRHLKTIEERGFQGIFAVFFNTSKKDNIMKQIRTEIIIHSSPSRIWNTLAQFKAMNEALKNRCEELIPIA